MIAWKGPSMTMPELREVTYVHRQGIRLYHEDRGIWIANYRFAEIVEELLPDFGVEVIRRHFFINRADKTQIIAEWVVTIPEAVSIPSIEYSIVALHSNARTTGYESRLYLGGRHERLGVGFCAVRVELLHARAPIHYEWKVNILFGLQQLLKKIGAVPLFVQRLSEVEIDDGRAGQIMLSLSQGAICMSQAREAIRLYFHPIYDEVKGSTLLDLYWCCALAIGNVPPERQFYRLVELRKRLIPYFDGEVSRL